jgi:hypothetical protein
VLLPSRMEESETRGNGGRILFNTIGEQPSQREMHLCSTLYAGQGAHPNMPGCSPNNPQRFASSLLGIETALSRVGISTPKKDKRSHPRPHALVHSE